MRGSNNRRMPRLACTVACALGAAAVLPHAAASATLPQYDHVVVVIMENHAYGQVVGSAYAPYINALAALGATFTQSFAIEHPSQPNYLDLFSGSNQGITDDSCPHTFAGVANLGSQILAANLTFAGYSEGLPAEGSTVCSSGTAPSTYQRKHNPWVNFANVPASSNLPYSSFPTDFSLLPTLSFVVPNQCHDMHDCSVAVGDVWVSAWMRTIIRSRAYRAGHTAVFLTFDEGSNRNGRIPTIVVSPYTHAGKVSHRRYSHFSLLKTTEKVLGIRRCLRKACSARGLSKAFRL